MTRHTFPVRSLILGSALAATAASGQSSDQPALKLQDPAPTLAGKFSLSYRAVFNSRASFSNLGGFPALTNPGPATGGTDHVYDDGFNRVDGSGNAGGLTTFWGYQNASQLPGNDTVVMNSSTAAATGASRNLDGDPQHGFELSYNHEIGRLDHNIRWGIEAAFNWTSFTFGDARSFNTDVTTISDAYALNGIIPPLPPFSGTAAGPGPLIGDTPTRTTALVPGGGATSGSRSIDASIYGLRVGPYLELPLCQRCSLTLGAGFTVAVIDSEFRINENTTIAGVGTQSFAARNSRADCLPGGYFSGQFNFAVTDRVSLFTGAQYQHLTRFSQQTAGRRANLDLGNTIAWTAGISFSF
jgi:hypothetical protein